MTNRAARLLPFLELESWVQPSGSTLKSLFDNLRNYPLLAILFVATKALDTQQGPFAAIGGFVLNAYLVTLGFFTLFQTAVLMTSFWIWLFFSEWRQRIALEQDLSSWSKPKLVLTAIGVCGALACFVSITAACLVAAGQIGRVYMRITQCA